MGLIKKLSYIVMFLFSLFSSYSVTIVRETSKKATETGVSEGFRSTVVTLFTIGVIILLFIGVLILFAWLLVKLYKKLSEYNKRKRDFLYYLFEDNVLQCHFNHDKRLKKRNFKLLWLFWKRKPVYIEKADGTLEVIGLYHGECYKKEGFYFLAIYNKLSMFKYIGQIIVIPINLKEKIVKKITGDRRTTLFLSCEGIDQVENTDYYLIPLLKNKNEFYDLSDFVHNKFIEPSVYRDTIKENLLSYREGIIRSVETNPYIHFGRRGGDNFKK